MMGTEQNLSALLRMRLVEHILHTWDIDIALDKTATLPPTPPRSSSLSCR
jgi:hypothetical protein